MSTKTFNQEELNKVLWAAADSSRGKVDASIYKDYVLTMLFFKYMSDLHKKTYAEYLKRFDGDIDRVEEKMRLDRFVLPETATFEAVYAQIEKDNIGEIINIALKEVEAENRGKLDKVFAVDFNSENTLGKLDERNRMLRNLLKDFAKVDFSEADEDIVGNAYMYMIERFGSAAGKKAGEFFTPRSIASLVARLAAPKAGDRIADMACGSGGLLLLAGEEVEKTGSKNYALYGQELTGTTYQLARMNMFLHQKDSARIEWGDTLNSPLLVENDQLMRFDVSVANPPFSLKKWGAENAENDKYNRFWRGIPPKDKGDYAFVTHMVETTKPKSGRGVIVVPHGVLFRGGAEGRIREALLKENIIDAVIGLPAGLFQTTGIPVAILIFDRSREVGGANESRKDVLFIEASKEFKAGKAQSTLTDENAAKIIDTYKGRKEIEKFSRKVSLKEIEEENDFNLNITRYVDTFEEEDEIDISANLKELSKVNAELKEVEKKMEEYLKMLNIA